MRRFLLLVVALVACLPVAAAAASPAEPVTTSTTILVSQRPNSLPRPDSGQKPTQPGDRGGALQYATFTLMCVGLAFIAFRIVASSRRARRRLQQSST